MKVVLPGKKTIERKIPRKALSKRSAEGEEVFLLGLPE